MRINNSIKNIITSVLGQFITIGLNFTTRSIFILMLGNEFLGINGLFTNIISILALAEMGIGSAIIYSLYKPIAEKDYIKIKGLMSFYNSAYKVISLIILIVGVAIIPLIPKIAKSDINNFRLIIIYLLFLCNSVASYLYAYKKSIIVADQKDYILSIYRNIFKVILNILQVIILIITKNYEMFLIIQIVVTITENILVAKKVDKMYTFLLNKDNVKLGKKEKNSIIKNVKALLYHKIGGVIVNSTDNILISKFVGITSVGLYSNYYLIIGALNLLIGQSFSALTASVGNLNAVESKEKSYNTYKLILFINFWIAGFSSICLWILFEPFITLWIGKQYLFKNYIVLIIVINFYILTIRRTTLLYKDSCGLFWNDRYKPIIESVVNIIVSIVLAPKLGISGVFIGTFISTLSSAFWMEPYVLYKYGFNRKVREYFKMFIVYTIIIILVGFSTTIICNTMTGTEIIVFIKKICVCILVPNGLLSICFHKKDEFKQVINLIKYILNNILKYRIKSWLNI
ncbi:lipopolysaccharide biosynthesis protein [Clostridium perfringens]|uniref:lipopolysaccharide biosynthesis protein n=2 Tax=Clostridium perfringens TaxID=1502 RepID=UPI001E02D7B7|nr:hypothetical protein [Clostridium perfringens]EHK2338409.1 oligosaccharide flippase family protein [Clostridium perfringens]MDK0553181.1 hypothetical protein [Clostridium perfringens]MDK0855095.1 hypothetical protein [Clostridium perfringens]WVL75784.1 hypothetical protein LMS42_008940 [Clostridium perfringens]